MKKSKLIRVISSVISLIMIITCFATLSVPSFAAESQLSFNISESPCKGNLSSYNLPTTASEMVQGKSYYVNLAATKDFYLDRYEVYIKSPTQKNYTLVESYDPSGYFRWYHFSYKFADEGTYYIKPIITTTSGNEYSGEIKITVNSNKKQTISYSEEKTDNTYKYDGNTYNTVPNLKKDYCFNQKDYSRFENSKGQNRGCTATAMCIAYSIYHDSTLSPNDVKWCSAGTSWEYCDRYKEGKRSYIGCTYTQKEALKCVYNCITNGKPIIIGVNGAGSDHVVTAVGVKEDANFNSLSLSDILIVDPYGGEICNLSKYKSIDTGWGLRIPIE